MLEELKALAQKISELQIKALETYIKHPKDIMDLGESQAYKICHEEIIKIVEGKENAMCK